MEGSAREGECQVGESLGESGRAWACGWVEAEVEFCGVACGWVTSQGGEDSEEPGQPRQAVLRRPCAQDLRLVGRACTSSPNDSSR